MARFPFASTDLLDPLPVVPRGPVGPRTARFLSIVIDPLFQRLSMAPDTSFLLPPGPRKI